MLNSIQSSFENVGKLLSKLDDIHNELGNLKHFENKDLAYNDLTIESLEVDKDGVESNIEHEIYNIKVRMIHLFEKMGVMSMIKEVNYIYNSEKYNTIDYFDFADIFYSPKIHKFELLFEVLTETSPNENASLAKYKIESLHKLLESTGYVVNQNNAIPRSENDLQKLMYSYISAFYPSTVRESPFPKQVGSYRPDFAIKELNTCIEFKYVTSKNEARKILGGLYEDIHAYSGSKDWTNFIAVIYMTDQFFTNEQMVEELKMSSIPENWKFILSFGNGTRIRNSQNNAPPPTG